MSELGITKLQKFNIESNFCMKEKILAVPTNIITGFLGSGKTSTILSLLKSKPSCERWAILVNEFGQIGIDGSLLNSYDSKDKSIFVREIPGGCMCCTCLLYTSPSPRDS